MPLYDEHILDGSGTFSMGPAELLSTLRLFFTTPARMPAKWVHSPA
jgi:hypothetical protein